MRRSGEIVHDSARSPTSLVPVRSMGSTRISVLYCGAPGCSIAKVSSWWASKLGGSAATRVVGWLRWEMDAWAGVRPAKFYPGMRSPLADPDGIDLVVIRENSEGMYPGREGDIAELARALPTVRDRFGRGLDRYKDGRFAVKVVTRDGAARIARFACELARRRKARGHAGKVTCVTKSNVLPQTDGLFHAIVKETVATYPDLAFEHFHVDDAARRIIRFPKTMDVVVC